ncbi:MAG: outer membrane protein assembly factor BamD [Endozoicomonas sp. (ex Botrylloides leachii)]|nr:outer membrane protein assembly factor BamD [Endozoicomonas sp. (ex Botrylloides leachii)]
MIILKYRLTHLIVLLFTVLVITGCASNPDKDRLPNSLSEADLYQLSNKYLDNSNYSEALKYLKALETRYPFGAFAEQAQLNIIYAYYMHSEPEAARAAADRYIRLHPQSSSTDYAYYMKGLASNTASVGLVERYLPLDITRRDPGQAMQSFNEFSELLKLYPDSKYAPDARQRMIALRDRLAEYQIHVATYYMKRKAYVAAIKRGQYVVENMQQTPAVPQALAIMIEGYQHLGLVKPANETLETLRLNYPNDPALDKKGNFIGNKVFSDVDPSVLNILTFGLLGDSGKGNSGKKGNTAKTAEPIQAPLPPKALK